HGEALRRWQRRTGWPVLADGLSGLRGLEGLRLVAGYDLLLDRPRRELDVDQVLRLGPLPASRRVQQWLQRQAGRQLLITEADPRPLDPLGRVQGQWSGGLAAWLEQWPAQRLQGGGSPQALRQAETWQEAEGRLQHWLDSQLGGDALQEPLLARQLSRLLPPGLPLMLANSSPVRDWESFADPAAPARPIFGFRGASGIDGTLSIACGLAEALGQLVLLTGDLALLHDSNGWLWHRQLRGRLTGVLIDNGGGGIFEQLPIRTDPPQAMDFERLFAMPQAVDQRALAALHGVPGRRLERLADLVEALPWALAHPLALLELRTDRRQDADLRRRLRTMAP
ncbi:MAG: 2-succinyl-5-enolpyruvyl-6-hydroxy-3-cyclohexene-1-carboxylate synthase, partial [Cyanobacteriota bacterium]